MAIPFGYFSVETTSKSSELKAVISFLIDGTSALAASFFTPSTSQAYGELGLAEFVNPNEDMFYNVLVMDVNKN